MQKTIAHCLENTSFFFPIIDIDIIRCKKTKGHYCETFTLENQRIII